MIQLKQNNDIVYQGFNLTENGVEPIGAPTFKQWEALGTFIRRSHRSVKFWHGDWLNYGQDTFDEWSQFFDNEDPNSEVYKKEMWVSKRIPPERRHPNLRWEHHAEAADLEPEDQKQLFKVAEESKLSLTKFRSLIKAYQMRLELPELSDEELKKTDPEVFVKVQEIIDSSIHTVELLEQLDWGSVHIDAKDFLFSHLKRVIGFHLDLLKKHDKQK